MKIKVRRGDTAVCRFCEKPIKYLGKNKGGWVDDSNGRACISVFDKSENRLVKLKTEHKPLRNNNMNTATTPTTLRQLTGADVPNTPLMHCLYKALSMRRASGSRTEAEFVGWLCNRLPVTMIDEAGNIHIDTVS